MTTFLALQPGRNRGVKLASWDDKERAGSRPIDGRFPALAHEIRRLLGWTGDGRPFLSSRMAAGKTGVNHATITTLARGHRASPDSLAKVASGLGGEYSRLLSLAGYITVEEMDPLSKIGTDIDISPLLALPFANISASAGDAALLGSANESEETLGHQVPPDLRTIRVEGDCMHPYYQHGDILFVREQESADPGQTVIALLDGEVVACKKFGVADDQPFLEAVNGHKKIDGSFRIVGVVVGYMRFGGP